MKTSREYRQRIEHTDTALLGLDFRKNFSEKVEQTAQGSDAVTIKNCVDMAVRDVEQSQAWVDGWTGCSFQP